MARPPLELADALCPASGQAAVAWPGFGRAILRHFRRQAVMQPGSNRSCEQGQKN